MASRGLYRVTSLAGWRNATDLIPRHHLSSFVTSSRIHPSSFQVMSDDRKTFVCYHPPATIPYQDTKPLRKQKMWEKKRLTSEEVTLVRKLREENDFIWSIATLSRFFKVSPAAIRGVAPTSDERRKELEEERETVKKMRPHKRKLYLLQRQTIRQNKLKELIAANNYTFPATATEPSPSK